MNVNLFSQRLEAIRWRLVELYQGSLTQAVPPMSLDSHSAAPQVSLLPEAFKELGVASEELQVAIEELLEQNEALLTAQAATEVERQRYQDLFEFAPDGYLVTDGNGMIQEANRAAAKLLSIAPRFLLGKPLVSFFPLEERQFFRTELSRLQYDGAPSRARGWSVRLQPRQGQPFEAALTVTVVPKVKSSLDAPAGGSNSPGVQVSTPITLRWLLRDVTDKQAETTVQNSSNPYQDALPQTYAKGETIPLIPQDVWVVRQGLVKLSTLGHNGEEVLVGLVGPPMPFGSGWTSLPIYQAAALSKVQLVCLSQTEIAASPYLAQTLLAQVNRRLQQTECLLAIAGQRQVKNRLQQLLRLLGQEVGQSVTEGTRIGVRLTHADLANACCTTRVTVTRLLSRLQQQGEILLDAEHHIILIGDRF